MTTKTTSADQTFSCTVTKEVETTLRVHEVEPGLFVFHMADKTLAKSVSGSLKLTPQPAPKAVQGVIDAENLAKMVAGKTYATKDVAHLTADLLEHFRTRGFNQSVDARKVWDSGYRTDVYDAIVRDGLSPSGLVRVNMSAHMLFDPFDRPLPVAILFGKNHGYVNGGRFDLAKLAAHLLTRPDVTVYARSKQQRAWSDGVDYDTAATTVEEALIGTTVDQAATSPAGTLFFRWAPSVEDYRRLWECCQSYGCKHPITERHRAVFDFDLLGFRAAGAARFDDVTKSLPDEDSGEDNED